MQLGAVLIHQEVLVGTDHKARQQALSLSIKASQHPSAGRPCLVDPFHLETPFSGDQETVLPLCRHEAMPMACFPAAAARFGAARFSLEQDQQQRFVYTTGKLQPQRQSGRTRPRRSSRTVHRTGG